ncbi:hypothetical protein NJ76_19175 [Rhodococcus sp. IITR03]|nr:hypothetical protein NJ76_19175 [Rhodococcus sp. IITR03]
MRVGVRADPAQRRRRGRRRRSGPARSGQAVAGGVHVGVDETGGDERAVQVDDLGVRVQGAAGPVLPDPHDRAVGDGHRGGIGGTGAVDAAADEKLGVRCRAHECPVCPVTALRGGAGCPRSPLRARCHGRRPARSRPDHRSGAGHPRRR